MRTLPLLCLPLIAACSSWFEEPDLGGTAISLSAPIAVQSQAIDVLKSRLARAGTRRGLVSATDDGLLLRVPDQVDSTNVSIAQRGELSVHQVDENWTTQRIDDVLTRAQGEPHSWARAEGLLPSQRLLRADESTGGWIVLFEQPSLTQEHIAAAHPLVGLDAQPSVRLRLNELGKQLLTETTRASRGERLAFVLDGAILSTPVVAEILDGGQLHLTVPTERDAAVLAALLATEPLPADVRVLSKEAYAPE